MLWNIDTPFGARVDGRLNREQIIWLVTSDADGTPQPSPVWFLRQGDELLIYSRPETPKLRNIARQPRVALHFHTNAGGGDVVIFHGSARHDPSGATPEESAAYIEKYRQGIANLGTTPEGFAQSYSELIRVRLERVRGH